MHRRALLASLAGASVATSAGCLDRAGSLLDDDSCDGIEIRSANVEVDYWCGVGRALLLDAVAESESCSGELRLEVVSDGEVVQHTFDSGDGEWHFSIENGAGTPSPGEVLLRCRRPEGSVLGEKRVTVDHYRDEPGLSIDRVFLESELVTYDDPVTVTVPVGETVETTFRIGNNGGTGSYEAHLLADGDSVATQSGEVEAAKDCTRATGPEVSLSHAFERAGSYDLSVELAASDREPRRETVGTVTVTDSDD